MKTFIKVMSLIGIRCCGSMLPKHRITNYHVTLPNVLISI